MLEPKDYPTSFLVTFNFEKNIRDPQRILATASSYIEALQNCDKMLLKSFHSELSTVLIIDNIEFGSFKIWLQQLIENIDNEALYELDPKKLIGKFLVKGKYLLLRALGKNNALPSKEELSQTANQIHASAQETGVLTMPAYSRIPEIEIAQNMKMLAEALSKLKEKESASFSSSEGNVQIAPGIAITDRQITELLASRTIENESEIILKVRKPDFLGETGWVFLFDKRNLSATIKDKEWLEQFHSGELDIRPGDALRVRLKETTQYDDSGNVIADDRAIVKVIEIIHQKDVYQSSLLEIPEKSDKS